jgi:hypothetical protein
VEYLGPGGDLPGVYQVGVKVEHNPRSNFADLTLGAADGRYVHRLGNRDARSRIPLEPSETQAKEAAILDLR